MNTNNIILFPGTKSVKQNGFARKQSASEKLIGPMTELAVWQALAEDRVIVHYQPQYEMGTKKLHAVEALVRLIGENGEVIYPDQFIAMAENSSMIVPLGRKVISLCCQQLAEWRQAGIELKHVSINLSAHQVEMDTDLIDFIDSCLAENGLEYSDIEFELTERQHLLAENNGKAVLTELAERGSRLVIDDFGVGYGSNIYLTELPVSALKIDLSMTQKVGKDTATTRVVQHMIDLATDLGIDVVAEGIEEPSQDARLREMGCGFGQGYGYARPMDQYALVAFMNQKVALRSV